MSLRQAAQQVLEVLVRVNASPHLQDLHHAFDEEITALKQALTEPQTTHWEGCEAVHPECRKPEQEHDGISWLKRDSGYFTAPTPRKPLTNAEIWNTYKNLWMFHPAEEPRLAGDVLKFARAIERAHGIGEQT